jgi:hypothetical protein
MIYDLRLTITTSAAYLTVQSPTVSSAEAMV